ncbi:MAG TPA: 30S ribosomal protein S15 [Caulifigura sp.]|jgi:small subunit ribosomal protein S15|nr:30S ribosomal protein S15 [Caulifigura sp.]
MAITKERKTELIGEYKRTDSDTGSPDVQIAVLTERINSLTSHLQSHRKDFSSRRGLLMLVSKRRRLLDYVRRLDPDRYVSLIGKLNLRK